MTDKGKVCFAQTKPVKRAPAAIKEMNQEFLLHLDRMKILKMK